MHSTCDISCIVLSYNTRATTEECVRSLSQSLNKTPISSQIIIVDNASHDGSVDMIVHVAKSLSTARCHIIPVLQKINTGYTKGNNIGLKHATGSNILYLNSDVFIQNVDWKELIAYFETNTHTGALTVDVRLPDGHRDDACHRGFPTPWNAFCYFSGLEKFTRPVPILRKIFGRYHLLQSYDEMKMHRIESGSGAFLLVRGSLLREIGGFDERFFMYGEDLDLCYEIHKRGFDLLFVPSMHVLHKKYQSGLQHNEKGKRSQTRIHFFQSMEIFLIKHYARTYWQWQMWCIRSAIRILPYFVRK